MRLRLVVRRNGLPEARLVWDVRLEDNPTIAKLLEQLNEDVPLEGGQWGLEDYVVELHDDDGTSFECLHYQPVRNVLKPDDRVFIRALDRDDTRRRRISGRYQISSDGRHLIDGVPFGRPRLRAPSGRPPIHIPPRKRPRISREEDEDSDTPMRLLMDGAAADAADGEFESDVPLDDTTDRSMSDEDDLDSPDEEDLAQELHKLEEENTAFNKDGGEEELPESSPEEQTLDLAALDKMTALQAAFPSAPLDICEKVLMACRGDLKTAYGHLVDGFAPKLSESALLAWPRASEPVKSKASPKQVSSGDQSVPNAEFSGEGQFEESSDDPVPSFVLQYDHRGLPPGSITSGKGLAQMAAIAARGRGSERRGEEDDDSAMPDGSDLGSKKTVEESDETTSSSGTSSSSENEESEDDSDDEDADSSDSDSDSESDNSGDNDSRSGLDEPIDHESSDSSSESDGTSDETDSGPEEISIDKSQTGISNRPGDEDSDSSGDSSSEAGSTSSPREQSDAPSQPVLSNAVSETSAAQLTRPVVVPPGAGKESTKNRNARRRVAKRAKKLAQQTEMASSTTTKMGDIESSSRESALFEAKRKALLDAIANGGIEVGPETALESSDILAVGTGSKRKREDNRTDPQCRSPPEPCDNTPKETAPSEDLSSASAQKRRRVDLGAGRRLVFGALGLRNPKSKKDEDDIRTKLMEDVRPLANPRLERQDNMDTEQPEDGNRSTVEMEEPDAWKAKIAYRAVECCREGIELSEPPFPFVQRWDSQQQGPSWFSKKNKRGGRNKRAQRNQTHYYEDDSRLGKRKHDESGEWGGEGYDVTFNGIEDTYSADIQLNYDDEDHDRSMDEDVVDEASQNVELEDLPPVPSDPSVLPALRPGEARVGMVVTWKKWSCSSATNWQPQLSNVSAVVVRISDDDATTLEVCLAKRDRHLDGNQKRYDPYTGQRLYDRFEAPDLDEDEDRDDDAERDDEVGYQTLRFSEMQDPRILQQPLDQMEGGGGIVEPSELAAATGPEQPPRVEKVGLSQAISDDISPSPGRYQGGAERLSEERGAGSTNELDSEAATSNATPHQPGQGQQATRLSVSDFSHPGSPSQQLHETTSQAISAMSQGRPTAEVIGIGSDLVGGDVGESTGYIPDTGTDTANAREKSSPPTFGIDDETDVIAGTPQVVHHRLAAPSAASSLRSGRQPDYSIGGDDDESTSYRDRATDDGISIVLGENKSGIGSEDMSTPTPTPAPEARTPGSGNGVDKAAHAMNPSPGNPSTPGSLSSLNTIWCTAVTSRNTQSPSKSQALSIEPSQTSRVLKDLDYEDAMRKLDDLSDGTRDLPSKITDESLDLKNHKWAGRGESSDDEREPIIKKSHSPQLLTASKISPPPRRRRSARPASQFSLPPGAQIFDLSSDSDPAVVEDYADDKVDGTYTPKSEGLPKGDGWVKKRDAGHLKSRRSSMAPLGSQSKGRGAYLSASQGHTPSVSSANPISDSIRPKSRKKLSARF
ncbi:hypothetical protein F5X99DRAFT_382930 [Biscogniauxia marginata]|nr:hypothetical protein F5X99DRAFT_382930 [Biscogniauxia marginata]